jgi:hypothetical protein
MQNHINFRTGKRGPVYAASSSTTVSSNVADDIDQACYAIYVSKHDVNAAVPIVGYPDINTADGIV